MFSEQNYKDLEKNIEKITHFPYWQWLDLYNITKTDDSIDRKYVNIIERLLSVEHK